MRHRLVWLALLTCSCVRGGFEERERILHGDARRDRPGEATSDRLPEQRASDGAPCSSWGAFSSPTRLGSVSSTFDDWSPSLGAGGLTLVLASYRPGGPGDSDLFQAARADPAAAFSAPTPIAVVNSASYDSSPVLSVDGRTLLFCSTRGGTDLTVWIATRADPGASFGAPSLLAGVNGPGGTTTWPHHLAADGLSLWLVSDRDGSEDIYVATRASADAPFAAPVPVPSLSSSSEECGVWLSRDGLEAFFGSARPGGLGRLDLWVARRTDRGAAFGAAENLSALNTSWDDAFPTLSDDGRTLYFNRDTSTGGGRDADLWIATRSCLSP